jgi:hypothetical protein
LKPFPCQFEGKQSFSWGEFYLGNHTAFATSKSHSQIVFKWEYFIYS